MDIKILDCTLRDGGYYNDWDFDAELTRNYLSVMAEAGVDYVELGLRQFLNEGYQGPHAYTSRRFIQRLGLPKGPTYGVMIDAKTILSQTLSHEASIDRLFSHKSEEGIGLVRVAAHFSEVPECFKMLSHLKKKGYLVGLNIMQSSLRDSNELSKLAGLVESWKSVNVLYFADSLGSMDKIEVDRVYCAIRSKWTGDVGFHAHNNMGQAISNVNTAIQLGCTWVDGTVTGMGRGAGNAEMEYLLEQPAINKGRKKTNTMFSLVVNYFDALKKMHGWGESMPYFYSAKLGLHPTYVQELCSDKYLDKKIMLEILNDLGEIEEPHIFSRSIMERVISKRGSDENVVGDEAPNIFKNKEVLLIAQTDSSVKYREAILDYANENDAILISINIPTNLLDFNYDLVAISHNQKYREDEFKYRKKDYKYIAPKAMFSDVSIDITHDYGVSIKKGHFKNYGRYACVPNRLTLAYAISFCLDAQAEKIALVGFSGYISDSHKQKEMQEFLTILISQDVNVYSLTPTTYAIPEFSIYAV